MFHLALKPARRRICLERAIETFGSSKQFARDVLGQNRLTLRKIAKTTDDERALTADITALATHYGSNEAHRRAHDDFAAAKRTLPIWLPTRASSLCAPM